MAVAVTAFFVLPFALACFIVLYLIMLCSVSLRFGIFLSLCACVWVSARECSFLIFIALGLSCSLFISAKTSLPTLKHVIQFFFDILPTYTHRQRRKPGVTTLYRSHCACVLVCMDSFFPSSCRLAQSHLCTMCMLKRDGDIMSLWFGVRERSLTHSFVENEEQNSYIWSHSLVVTSNSFAY